MKSNDGSKLPPPRGVAVTITNRCNLRCKSCAIWQDMPSKDEMGNPVLSPQEQRDLAKQLKDWGVSLVSYGTIGEAFLSRDFPDLLAYCDTLNLPSKAFTNGTVMPQKVAEKTVASGISVLMTSIDGPTAAIHDDLRGMKGSFAKAVAAIRAIQAEKERQGRDLPKLGVATVLSRANYECIPDMADLCQSIGVGSLTVFYVATIDQAVVENLERHIELPEVANTHRFDLPDELHVTEEQQAALWESADRLRARCKEYEIELDFHVNTDDNFNKCPVLWDRTFVDAFGNIYPCPMMTSNMGLGNIREKPLEEIWNSDQYNRLRDVIRRRNEGEISLDICDRCCMMPARVVTAQK